MVPALAESHTATRLHEAPSPFLIMGCPRSGTTLLSQLLGNHSRIAVFVESLYYPLFRGDLHRYGDLRRPPNLRRLIDNFREMVYLHGLYEVEPPTTRELESAVPAPTFEAVFVTFLQLYALRQGKVRCGEKTAGHHEYIADIREGLPGSPIVFAMRDPRDVVLSIHEMFGARLESGAELWNRAFRSYQRGAGDAYLLRYEELVSDPRPTLEGLCTFLGEKYDPRMLEFFGHLPERLRDAPHHQKLSTPISDTSVGRFRTLPAAEIAQIEYACAVGMEALGYKPTGGRAATASIAPRRATPLEGVEDRLRRFRRRSHRLSWHRWKMRLRVRARYLLTFGPLRDHEVGHTATTALLPRSATPPAMNRPPGPLARGRRKFLGLLAPGLQYSLKRRYWRRAWARTDVPSPRTFWFLPEGVIPRQIKMVVQDGWFEPGGKVLDIGCGEGRIAQFLASAGFDVLAIDFAAPAIERARRLFGESEGLRFRVADICEEIPAPGPFDAIVDRGCYHGLPTRLQPAYLETVSACSRAGTRLLLMVKVTEHTDVSSETRALLWDRTLQELTARFTPRFALDRAEPVWFNSRGDDDEAQSLPGLVLWLTRREDTRDAAPPPAPLLKGGSCR